MNILMVIPAGSRSRRLPNKNILPLGKRPLLCWSVGSAYKAKKMLTGHHVDICLVADSDEYYEHAIKHSDIPISEFVPQYVKSEGELSEDCDTGLVIRDAMQKMEMHLSKGTSFAYHDFKYDLCVTLQPTSPFRKPERIVYLIDMANSTHASCLFTAKPVKEFPQWMFRDVGETFLGVPPRYLSSIIAQDLPKLYFPDGSIYVTKRDTILKGQVYGDDPIPIQYVDWNPIESVDIEDQFDFDFCSWLIESGKVKQ
jgi:CMP-N,N'-diacetyllegionaminic acid synthase